MKKIINLLLISILIFSLTACSEKTNTENDNGACKSTSAVVFDIQTNVFCIRI